MSKQFDHQVIRSDGRILGTYDDSDVASQMKRRFERLAGARGSKNTFVIFTKERKDEPVEQGAASITPELAPSGASPD